MTTPTPQPIPGVVAEFLGRDDRVERCPPNADYARLVVEEVLREECEDMLHAAAQGRWRKANTYSYDAARKSVEAWLLAGGWRIRAATGAHLAVTRVVDAWLGTSGDPGPRVARAFGASRKARHDDEYPSPQAATRTPDELRALVLDNARLVNLVRVALGLATEPNIVPTEANLAGRPES